MEINPTNQLKKESLCLFWVWFFSTQVKWWLYTEPFCTFRNTCLGADFKAIRNSSIIQKNKDWSTAHFCLPGLRPSSLIKSGLQAQNLWENFVMRVSRYSPRSSGAWMCLKNSLSAFGKNWFLKLCSVTRSSKTSLLVEWKPILLEKFLLTV